MTFFDSIKKCYSKFFTFKGRACRSEYWWFQLYLWMTILACGIGGALTESQSGLGYLLLVLGIIAIFSAFIPAISVKVRRCHDIGRSGWWIAAQCIPYIGYVVAIINDISFMFKGDTGPNEYGEDPLEENELNLDYTTLSSCYSHQDEAAPTSSIVKDNTVNIINNFNSDIPDINGGNVAENEEEVSRPVTIGQEAVPLAEVEEDVPDVDIDCHLDKDFSNEPTDNNNNNNDTLSGNIQKIERPQLVTEEEKQKGRWIDL